MGWQQYSRPLWLSRGNPHILYLKAMTVQMRGWWTGFPQRRRWQRELHCSGLIVYLAVSMFAWPESPFRFTQDFRPRLSSVAPCGGWCLVVLSLFVYPVCSIDWSLRVERPETMVLDLLLRTYAPNRFGLACSVPRRGVRGYVCFAIACGHSLRFTGADARPPLAERWNFPVTYRSTFSG